MALDLVPSTATPWARPPSPLAAVPSPSVWGDGTHCFCLPSAILFPDWPSVPGRGPLLSKAAIFPS